MGKDMNENKISVTVDWDLEYDEESLNSRIENEIVRQATKKYLEGLEKTFEKKLEKMLHDQAFKIVKDINKFQLDKCNTNGLKETISMEDYIVKKSLESLDIKRDEYGRTGHDARNEKKTMVEWVVKDIISSKNKEFNKALSEEISKIEAEYQKSLQSIISNTLAPIYKKLVDKLNS